MIGASDRLSIKLTHIFFINHQIISVQIMRCIRKQRHARVPYHHINLRQVSRIRHFKFAQLFRQNRCVDIGTAVVVLVCLIIAIPSLIGGFDRFSVFVKFFKIFLWGDPAVKFRVVALTNIQLPGHAGNPADILICFRFCTFFFGVSFRSYLQFPFGFLSIL